MALAVAVTILGLAAGIHLLIKVKQAGLGKLYQGLAWLVIVMAFAFNICCVVRGAMHRHHHHFHHHQMDCHMGPGCMPGDANCTMKMDSTGHCNMKAASEAHTCPYMKDSTKK